MGGSRLSLCGLMAAVVFFFAFLLNPSAIDARIRPVGFPIPSRMTSLGETVTPGEYTLLRQAIKANWERDKAKQPQMGRGAPPSLNNFSAERIRLGALGEGMVVHGQPCGATGNCPMAVYVREPHGYRRVIKAGGGGYALLPSAGPVPDIAFYWNMSAGESNAYLFHYANGKFVQTRTADCNGKNSSDLCIAMRRHSQSPSGGISHAEYEALRPAIEAALEKQSPALARRYSFAGAHAVGVLWMQEVKATAVGLGPCSFNQNCSISIYARHYQNPKSRYFPLMHDVMGWGVTDSTFSGLAPAHISFVVARRLSPNEDELTRYTTPLTISGHTFDLTRDSKLLPDACEIVTPRSGRWPARWNAAALVAKPVSCFKTSAPGKSYLPLTDTTNVGTVVQDGTGTVWAMGQGFPSRLYRWRNGFWNKVPSPITVTASSPRQLEFLRANRMLPQPLGLWKGPDKGVLSLWLKSPSTQKTELVWSRGAATKILATLPSVKQPDSLNHMDVTTAVPASQGIVLITGRAGDSFRNGVRVSGPAPGLFSVDAKGHVQRIYTFSPDEYIRDGSLGSSPFNFLPLHATRDAQGKVWIWCGVQWPGRFRGKALLGFLVTNGKTVEYHRRIPGLFGLRLTSVSVWDRHHLAVSVFDRGIYILNTDTFEARPLPEPEPGVFRFVKKVFSVGRDHYVLTLGVPYGRWMPLIERPFLFGDLWRLRHGKWEKVLASIGNASGAGAATRKGLWLGARNFHGLWFVPNQGSARKINWRQGLPIGTVNGLFRLPDGRLLVYGRTLNSPHTVEIQPESLLAQRPAATQFSMLHPRTNIESDLHHNLWGMLPRRILGEWNGSQWVRHPIPLGIAPDSIVHLDVDTRGRVWLFPNCRLGPMGFFNPASGSWSVYRTYRGALEQRSHPVTFLHPADDESRPIYGPGLQIVFVGACWGINYFDGASWRLFQGGNIPSGRNIAIPPYFDAAGHLALNIRNTTMQWNPQSGWQGTATSPPANYLPLITNPFAPPPSPPAGCETPAPSALVKDSLGQSWWVAGDALYEGVSGHCRKILSGSARQPFIDGRRLVAVKIGPQGSAFLETNGPFSYIKLPRAAYAAKSLQAAAEHHSAP